MTSHVRKPSSSLGKKLALWSILLLFVTAGLVQAKALPDFRPPSVPLFVCDPYFGAWSAADKLTDKRTEHWTGKPYPMTSIVKVDGKAFRIMGDQPDLIGPMEQVDLTVLPTQTIYTFEGAGVQVKLTFLQAALPDDLDLISSPFAYVTWECSSIDGEEHHVSVYFDAELNFVVNVPSQDVTWGREDVKGLDVLKAGSVDQKILGAKGDDIRIDWGYFYVAASKKAKPVSAIVKAVDSRAAFIHGKDQPTGVDKDMPRAVNEEAPVLSMSFDLPTIKKSAKSSRRCQVILAYDDIKSIHYFSEELPGFWTRKGTTIQDLMIMANKKYKSIAKRCAKFDAELLEDLKDAGGPDYQIIGSLSYRQALGANKIALGKTGMPLMFSKENNSNGCMGTVDVFYPFAPQVLLMNPTLAKASFVPILEYGRCEERWRFPFAPHDIGTYPHAKGQAYGGGERSEENQMPVEECGNMILLVAAVVQAENDITFAKDYWDVLSTWAEYLKSKGLDPENQLCTDDFAGHLAHNVNLSVKAIVALGAYAKMADMMGEDETAASFRKTAEQYVQDWMKMADNGDHYRLAFDREGTWSQKYNLVWDLILDLNLFPDSIAKKEMAYYKKVQNEYGLPLDNRSKYTKLDWITWTASITNDRDDFIALIKPIVKFINTTPDRVGLTDWYWTHNARHRGFKARPVLGGVFIKLMCDAKVWKKYVKDADKLKGKWGPIAKPPVITTVVPISRRDGIKWFYTMSNPGDNWFKADFDAKAAGWKEGEAGFGTRGTPGARIRTEWNTSDIWICRTFDIAEVSDGLNLLLHHDEDAEVYVNGTLIKKIAGYTSDYDAYPLSAEAIKAIKKGKNTIAIHCHQTTGGQYIDAGFATVVYPD